MSNTTQIVNNLTKPLIKSFANVGASLTTAQARINEGNLGPGSEKLSFSQRADLVKEANEKLAEAISVPKFSFNAMNAWKQSTAKMFSDIKDGNGDIDALVKAVKREAGSKFNDSFEALVKTAAENIDKLDIRKITDLLATGIKQAEAAEESLLEEYDTADNYGQLPGNLTIEEADYTKLADSYPELKSLLA